jgi:hypothetical protein
VPDSVVRQALGLHHLLGVNAVSGDANHPDDIIYDIAGGVSAGVYTHTKCANTADSTRLHAVVP